MTNGWSLKIAYWMWLALFPVSALALVGAALRTPLLVEIAWMWLMVTCLATIVYFVESACVAICE